MITPDLWSPTQSPQTMPDKPIGGIEESAIWYKIKLGTPLSVAVANAYNAERQRKLAEALAYYTGSEVTYTPPTEEANQDVMKLADVRTDRGPGESFEAYRAKLAHGEIKRMVAEAADKFDVPEMRFGHE